MASFGSSSSAVSSDQSSVEDLMTGTNTVNQPGLVSYVQCNFQNEINSRNNLKERDTNPATLDHSYAKSWSAHPFASKTLPTRTLFFNYPSRSLCGTLNQGEGEIVDVEGPSLSQITSYDAMKARLAMGECERYVSSTLPAANYDEKDGINDNDGDDWDERVPKTNWSFSQIRLFSRATRILHCDRLARLASEGASNEPVVRRIAIDKSAKRIRQLFGSFNWDSKLTQWLHTIFMDHLSAAYLAAYLDILQVLKSKIPVLVDNMMAIPPPAGKSVASSGSYNGSSVNESLAQLLKRPWDPTSVSYSQKLKKLPGSPFIVLAPFGPSPSVVNHLRRMRFWNSQFASLGKIVPVTMHSVNGGRNQRINESLENMLSATRNKVAELKTSFANRPIVLVGWNIGALVACHIALAERLAAVVCLGFPSNGLAGVRGEVDDPLLEIKTPTLFVLGHMSTLCNIDDLEDMRECMKVETGLVIVGGADELLRVSHKKKRLEGVTQTMVDRYIMEEVNIFLISVLSGFVPESADVTIRGAASSSLVVTGMTKTTQGRRKRKSTGLEDEELVDVGSMSNQWKPEEKKGFQQLGFFSNQDVYGIQQSPLLASLNSPPLDSGLKIIGRRSCGTVRAASVPKKPKFNPIVTPIESSSSTTTSDSSNNSLPGGSAVSLWDHANTQMETAAAAQTSSETNSKFQSSPSATSGGIMVNIGAMSSLGHVRTSVTNSPQKSTTTAMTSLVNKTSPPKTVSTLISHTEVASSSPLSLLPPPSPSTASGVQRSGPTYTRSLPITIHSVPVRSAFSVPRTGVQSTLSSLMTYALGSKRTQGASTSTTTSTSSPTTSSPTTSLLFTNKTGTAFETIRQAGRLIVCKSSETTNREKFLDQVQAIQKMQFHDFPLTTASLTGMSGSPIITQAKILTSRGLDLKKLQTLSTSIAGQLAGSSTTTSTSTATTTMPSLLIATGGGGKPLFVSGSAVSIAKMCQSVSSAETASCSSSGDMISSSAVAQSVLEQAKRANPTLNFTVSSVKLHIPERRSTPSNSNAAMTTTTLPSNVSFIMLSSNSSPTKKIEKSEEGDEEAAMREEQALLDVNADAALLLDLARSAGPPANVTSWHQQQQQQLAPLPQPALPLEMPLQFTPEVPIVPDMPSEQVDMAPVDQVDIAPADQVDVAPKTSLVEVGLDTPSSDVPINEPVAKETLTSGTLPDKSVEVVAAVVQEPEKRPVSTEIIILDSDTDEGESIGCSKEADQLEQKQQQEATQSEVIDVPAAAPPASSSGSGSSRSKPPPFPTIAATRTRRVRAPKYMYYEV